ncbi:MAG TPA: SGNH/GDSL hydrolase family protein [Gaiellaceae bacterium]|nr:SGNH/GDSL hydrolase family protein [Gaiellaceae bacterium]
MGRLTARILTLAAAAALALGGASGAGGGPPTSLRVLFVGNSLTATNDLPAGVARIAGRAGRRLEYRTVAPGGFALEDHWSQGEARSALAAGGWDVVVMQQGPSALPESQANLREWATRWAAEARARGATPALLTVWPESYRRGALSAVIGSYRRAATAARAELLPAGGAWQAAWRCEPVALYGRDGFHPSVLGTYAAALVVYGRLFRAPLLGVSAPAGVRPRTARLLQWSAATSLGRRLPRSRRCGR